MKKFLIALGWIISASAVEAEVQVDNDRVTVLKIRVEAHEEIDSHRDEYPQILFSAKGGTITRLEADGSKTEVTLPKGVAVFREADPPGQLHKSINNSCKPIDMISVQLKK